MSTITAAEPPSDILCERASAPVHQPDGSCGQEGEGLVPQGRGLWRVGMKGWRTEDRWRSKSQLMVCCRADGHEGEHYDAHDEVAWA